MEDEPHEDHPKPSTNDRNAALVKDTINQDQRLTQEMPAKELGLNAEAVSRFFDYHPGDGAMVERVEYQPPNLATLRHNLTVWMRYTTKSEQEAVIWGQRGNLIDGFRTF